MARLFDDASSEYLKRASTPLTAPPITLACWFYIDDSTSAQYLMNVGTAGTQDHRFSLLVLAAAGGSLVRATTRDTVNTNADTSTGYTNNTWHHACAVFAAANDRRVYIDGGSKGTDATSRTPVGADAIFIGARPNPSDYLSGRLAEAAMWDVALSDAEVAMLADGFSPLFIRGNGVAGGATSQGPTYVGTGAGAGWTNPANITADDNTYADYSIPTGGTSGALIGTNVGSTIPTDATIDGITFEFGRYTTAGPSSAVDATIQMIDEAGSPVGDNKSAGATWATAEENVSFGGAADKWGWATVTPAKLNHANSGIQIIADHAGAPVTVQAHVDYFRRTVNYTTASGVGLVDYWPLGGIYGRHDKGIVGAYDLTAFNTPSWADHAGGMIYPSGALVVPPVPAVGGTIAPLMYHYMRQRKAG